MKKSTLIAFLIATGWTKAIAEKIAANTPDEGEDPKAEDTETWVSSFKETQTELLKNDKDFIGEIKKGQYAIASQQFLSKIKKLVPELTSDEIKDKTTDEIINLALGKIRVKGDSTAQQLQEENVKLQSELKKLREEEIPTIEKRVDEHRNAITIETKLNKMITNLPKKLRVGERAAIATLKEKLQEGRISVGLDANGELEFFKMEGDTKLKIKNKDNTGFVNPLDLVTETLDAEKLLENSGAGGSGGDDDKKKKFPIEGGGDDKAKEDLYRRFPHLKKAEEHKEELKVTLKKADA